MSRFHNYRCSYYLSLSFHDSHPTFHTSIYKQHLCYLIGLLFVSWIHILQMPGKCCAPCCKGNYDSQGCSGKVAVFKFPKTGDLLQKWIRKINRKDFTPSPQAVVCAAHFPPAAVITEDTVTRDDGTILTVKRDYLKLAKDAYQSIFPNQPKYLSQESIPQRKTPNRDEHY